MGYELHISRGYRYAETGHTKITIEEWGRVILERKELEIIENSEGINPVTKETYFCSSNS